MASLEQEYVRLHQSSSQRDIPDHGLAPVTAMITETLFSRAIVFISHGRSVYKAELYMVPE